jgi:hypothetical protein
MLDENYGGPHKVQDQLSNELNSLPVLMDVKKSSLQRFRLTLMLHYNHYKETEPWALRTPNTMLLKSFKSKVDAKIGARYQDFLDQKNVPDDFISFRQWLHAEFVKADLQEEQWHSAEKSKTFRSDRRKSRYYKCSEAETQPTDEKSEAENEPPDSDGAEEGVYAQQDGEASSDSEASLSEGQFYALKRDYQRAKKKFLPWKGKKSSSQRSERSKKANASGKSDYRAKRKSTRKFTPGDFEKFSCPGCRTNDHWPAKCQKFAQEPTMMRVGLARRGNICFHCLSGRHFMVDCKTDPKKTCGIKKCTDRHHPLLHRPPHQVKVEDMLSDESDLPSEDEMINHCDQVFNTMIVCNLGRFLRTKNHRKSLRY